LLGRENYPNNLPIQPTPFIGREKEVAAVQNLLRRDDVRLLTLTGVGGTGKTRLGLQVAADLRKLFTGEVYFVKLAPISDPNFVVPTIAQALGIRVATNQSLLEHLKVELQQQQLLLLLDNFEQVVSAAVQVTDLLSACAKLNVLVTSREALRVRAEHVFAVPPLALPNPTRLPELAEFSHYAAIALFIQRAQAVKPDFQLTPVNAQTIAEICARLDGLPLAIELAAARLKLLSLRALLARLNQRLQVLTSGARDAPVRQQTLRNTIAWSYDLLKAEEQRIFQRLSVFVSGCTLEAAEAMCAALDGSIGAVSVLDILTSLIDKSLLQQVMYEEHEPRLAMLETIREFGLETLATSGELDDTRKAHAAYFLTLAERAAAAIRGPQQAKWLERLERELDNLRAALQWSVEQGEANQDMAMAMLFSKALAGFWKTRGHYSEGRAFLKRVLAGSKGSMTSLRAGALNIAADLAAAQGDYAEAEELSNESLALSRGLEDTRNIATSLSLLADVAVTKDDPLTARTLVEEALALYKELGDKQGIANSLFELGWQAKQQEEYTQARALLEQSLVLHRELGDKGGISHTLFQLADVLFRVQGGSATAYTGRFFGETKVRGKEKKEEQSMTF
jgi:predicted ATPase